MRATHVVTGATGLVGGALVLELLLRTDGFVVCPVRARDEEPDVRLATFLRAAARGYGYGADLDGDIARRCTAVPGDLTAPLCGVDPAQLPGGAAEFWHSAADLRYENRYWPQIRHSNVTGTGHAVGLARALGCTVYNQVSTAAVAGGKTGTALEEPGTEEQADNRYEQSKILGEQVASAAGGMTVRVLRPSIVVGHSHTRHVAGGLSGVYGFLHRLVRLRASLENPGHRLRLDADPHAFLNIVPVDLVAADAVSLSLARGPAGIYHLTHPRPLPVRTHMEAMCTAVGLPAPAYVLDRHELTGPDRTFDLLLAFYRPYLRDTRHFDQSTLRSVLPAPALARWRPGTTDLAGFYGWYTTHAGHHAQRSETKLVPPPSTAYSPPVR